MDRAAVIVCLLIAVGIGVCGYAFPISISNQTSLIANSSQTPVIATPTPTPTPTDEDCMWCGTDCVPKDSERVCPMIMPPKNCTCECVDGECTKVCESPTPAPTPSPTVTPTPMCTRDYWQDSFNRTWVIIECRTTGIEPIHFVCFGKVDGQKKCFYEEVLAYSGESR